MLGSFTPTSPATSTSSSLALNYCLPSTLPFIFSCLFCGPHTILITDTGFTWTLTSFQSPTKMFEPNLTECLQKSRNTAQKVPDTAPPHNCSWGPQAQTQRGCFLGSTNFHGVRCSPTPFKQISTPLSWTEDTSFPTMHSPSNAWFVLWWQRSALRSEKHIHTW